MSFSLSIVSALVTVLSADTYYTCALNHDTNPCPPPRWKPTYNLTLSTICQPGGSANAQSYFIPPPDKPWGLVSLDWTTASQIWEHGTSNKNKSTVEATSITGCELIKNSSNPNTRCMIYHNMEVALQVIESQRKVMYDPSKTDWWLQYTDGKGNKNGTIYNYPLSETGDQYFWDYRNENAANYYIESVLNTTMNPFVDGTYSDCIKGVPSGEKGSAQAMNLTQADIDELDKAQQLINQKLIDRLIANGKYMWQAFGYEDRGGPDITQSGCSQFMNQNCEMLNNKTKNGNYTMLMGFDANNPMQSLAAFLITRPEFAWLGYGWESDMKDWNSVFLYDVGVPKENVCHVLKDGVFQREWSYGNVTLDCNKWEGTVPHK